MTWSSSAFRFGAAATLLILVLALRETAPGARAGQASPPAAPTDAQRCTALTTSTFEDLAHAPTRITSARLVDVPADPQAAGILAGSPIKQYCQVLGDVVPQNKFELRLPLPTQWNQRFLSHPVRRVLRRAQRERLQRRTGARVRLHDRQWRS